MRYLIILLAFVINGNTAFAVFDMNQNCKQAYIEIINLRFESGEAILLNEKELNPENDFPYYIDNYIDFLKAVIGEKQTDLIKFKENIPGRIKKLENSDKSSPYYRYCLAEVYFQYGLTRLKFNEYVSGAFELNKAYRLLERNKEEFPEFILNLKTLGMMHLLVSTIQDNYKWTRTIISTEVSTSEGIDELSRVLTNSFADEEFAHLKTECLFIYTYVIFNISRDYSLIPDLMSLYNDSGFSDEPAQNPFLKYSLAKIFIHNDENDKAINLLTSYKVDTNAYPFYYLEYLTARAKLNRLDKDTYKYLFRFLQNFEGTYYIKAGYQKLAWYYLINGKTEKYQHYIGEVLTHGTNIIDEDKQAQNEAKSGIVPNIDLLKARLLCDGGYYTKALEAMDIMKNSNKLKCFKDSLEYSYRKARILHRSGRAEEAMLFYQETISMGSGKDFYFAANSALMLGKIYEKSSKYSDAEFYYKKCLKMKYSDYNEGISRNARKSLKRIQSKT